MKQALEDIDAAKHGKNHTGLGESHVSFRNGNGVGKTNHSTSVTVENGATGTVPSTSSLPGEITKKNVFIMNNAIIARIIF